MAETRKYGLQKITLADFPGEVAATVFSTGCNLRCPYCHNAELAAGATPAAFFTLDEIFDYFKKRQGVLTGVCLSGGEALLDPNLEKIIHFLKSLNYKIKLDTNGTYPDKLKTLKLDFIAMDIKTSLEKYELMLPKTPNTVERIQESIKYIIQSGIAHEFRTTCMPNIVTQEDIQKICQLIKGCNHYALAQFDPTSTLDPAAQEVEPYSRQTLETFKSIVEKNGISVNIRGKF